MLLSFQERAEQLDKEHKGTLKKFNTMLRAYKKTFKEIESSKKSHPQQLADNYTHFDYFEDGHELYSGSWIADDDGVRKESFRGGMCVDEKEIYEICMNVDSIIADKLTESIIIGTSYDILEAHYGILPISRRSFYRRKGTAQRLMRQRMAHLVEEKNGQYMIVWGREE